MSDSSRTEQILVDWKNKGSARELHGTVLYCAVYVTDANSVWTKQSREDCRRGVREGIGRLERAASAARAALSCRVAEWELKLARPFNADDASSYPTVDALARQHRHTSAANLTKKLAENFGAGEVVYAFILNTKGRAVASPSSRCSPDPASLPEWELLFFAEEGSFSSALVHETLHTFGAIDYYYPADVNRAARKHFPKSVMLTAGEDSVIDDFTSYLVGWRSGLTRRAQAFYDEIRCTPPDSFSQALKQQNTVDGEVRGMLGANGVYTGEVHNKRYHGYGRYDFFDGSSHEGGWRHGMRWGEGIVTMKDGTSYRGTWVKNEVVGELKRLKASELAAAREEVAAAVRKEHGKAPAGSAQKKRSREPKQTPRQQTQRQTGRQTGQSAVRDPVLASLEIGGRLLFGSWGGERIEWQVIDKSADCLLLLSRDCLAFGPFSDCSANAPWGRSCLRAWLNGAFLQNAFTDSQRARIAEVRIPLAQQEAIVDRVFLLNRQDVLRRVPMELRAAGACAAAKRQLSAYWHEKSTFTWWLRTRGSVSGSAAAIGPLGSELAAGVPVTVDTVGVRPAFWLRFA